ncbi:hypothetical protein [Kaistella palustris]|uniref:hypothetical protein n=1 Tax=Kaistella palustris TaxID=493376 RepID=UPI00040DB831|nr:hypothetical protein [Kaistella palustris]
MKKLVLITTLIFIISCQKDGNTSGLKTAQDSLSLKTDSGTVSAGEIPNQIHLETFAFPPEVNGCSCYFSANKADFDDEKYIYIDDYGNNAFIKTNGKMIKFEMKEGDFDPENFSKTIKNSDFTISITGQKVKELGEVMMFQGTMTVENKTGEKTVTPIYGECGC